MVNGLLKKCILNSFVTIKKFDEFAWLMWYNNFVANVKISNFEIKLICRRLKKVKGNKEIVRCYG